MQELDDKQEEELNRRSKLKEDEVHYGTNCPKCDLDFVNEGYEPYVVDGVNYPIITGFSDHEGDQSWTEHAMCKKCKIPAFYSDGN